MEQTGPFPSRAARVALFSGNYNCLPDGANQALNRRVDVKRITPLITVANN